VKKIHWDKAEYRKVGAQYELLRSNGVLRKEALREAQKVLPNERWRKFASSSDVSKVSNRFDNGSRKATTKAKSPDTLDNYMHHMAVIVVDVFEKHFVNEMKKRFGV
jgi:hypothetical protein